MNKLIVLIALVLGACVESTDSPRYGDCGSPPAIPYWEYTGPFGGAPAEIHMPSHLFEQDLAWRKTMSAWAECVSGERPVQCLNDDCTRRD